MRACWLKLIHPIDGANLLDSNTRALADFSDNSVCFSERATSAVIVRNGDDLRAQRLSPSPYRLLPSEAMTAINRAGSSKNNALVLGARTGLGADIAAALIRHGWNVSALSRRREQRHSDRLTDVVWHQGDLLRDRVPFEAARSARLIVHALGTPLSDVASESMRQIERTIDVAASIGARILLPATLDVFGPDAPALVDESSRQHPVTPRGVVHMAIERRLREASASGIKSVILRAGDLFGPTIQHSPLIRLMLGRGRRATTSITYPGATNVGHSWAYSPDVAETLALLAARDTELAPFDVYHFAGHWDRDGAAMINSIRRAAGHHRLRVKPFHWSLLRMAAPLDESLSALAQTEYRWRMPLRLDNRKLLSLLGTEPHTALDQAVIATLRALRCL